MAGRGAQLQPVSSPGRCAGVNVPTLRAGALLVYVIFVSSLTDDSSGMANFLCRPHEHGEDMLAPMSAILNDYSEQHHSSAVCIVLRGLYALCESEVKLAFAGDFHW